MFLKNFIVKYVLLHAFGSEKIASTNMTNYKKKNDKQKKKLRPSGLIILLQYWNSCLAILQFELTPWFWIAKIIMVLRINVNINRGLIIF